MIPIHTSQILLGRPWQFSRKTTHDGIRNKYIIVKDDKIITLVPLTPKQVYDDQIKLKIEHDDIGIENQSEGQYKKKPSYSTTIQNNSPTTQNHSAKNLNHLVTSKTNPNLAENKGMT